jgi:hypothetical protein
MQGARHQPSRENQTPESPRNSGRFNAVYGLLGGVVLSIEYETRATNPLIGHWWGFFVPMIPGLVLIGGLLIQLQIYNRHRRRVREGS